MLQYITMNVNKRCKRIYTSHAVAYCIALHRLSVWCHRWWLLMIPFVNVSYFFFIHSNSLHFICIRFIFKREKKNLIMTCIECNVISVAQIKWKKCAHRSTLDAATVQHENKNEINTFQNISKHFPIHRTLYFSAHPTKWRESIDPYSIGSSNPDEIFLFNVFVKNE